MMIGRGAPWLLLCLASGGCDLLFQIDHISSSSRDDANGPDDTLTIDGRPDDSMTDTTGSPDAATACANPTFYEFFNEPTACTSFGGSHSTNADVVQQNGVLSITPKNAAGQLPDGGCTTALNNIPFGSGLTVVVNSSVTGTDAFTNVLAQGANAQIQVKDGLLHFQTANNGADIGQSVGYSPIAMRWWRIRPVGTTAMRAEYSDKGMNWTQLGVDYGAVPPTMIGISITAGTLTIGNVGTTVFDQVTVCP